MCCVLDTFFYMKIDGFLKFFFSGIVICVFVFVTFLSLLWFVLTFACFLQLLPNGELHPCFVAKHEENIAKNRYKTTFPCEYIQTKLILLQYTYTMKKVFYFYLYIMCFYRIRYNNDTSNELF